jgi:L-seryl-tRNA(Ser) seleniumtransferase
MTAAFRQLPAVHEVLAAPEMQALADQPREMLLTAIRTELERIRQEIRNGQQPAMDLPALAAAVQARLAEAVRPRLRRVINATGILLHTNLGRAPIAAAAGQAACEAAKGYLNLEMDLASGQRSSRQDAVRDWICQLTGAPAATVVNNNAAATVIVLRALAAGKEVIVSRGQLVEIGGSFRIPDIMRVSGAVLREVGTTNITRKSDYEAAVTENTAALLRVHASNYRIVGHTEAVSLPELVEIARARKLLVVDDIGSGALLDFARWGLQEEPLARISLAQGADVVLFSGDKLLGGPQAGIIAGRPDLIRRIEKDPLMRAFRLDKMTLAALEATLRLYLEEATALKEIPLLRMLEQSSDLLRQRAEDLATRLRNLPGLRLVEVREDYCFVGGGSLPDQQLPTCVVAVQAAALSDADFAQSLRLGDPAVVPRVKEGHILFDLRTIFPEQEEAVVGAVKQALA